MWSPSLVVIVLGAQRLLFPDVVNKAGGHHHSRGKQPPPAIVVPLQQRNDELGLISFGREIDTGGEPSSLAISNALDVFPGVAPPTSTGVARDAQHRVFVSATCGPTAEGTFSEGTFEVAYDELTPAPMFNLTERAPRANGNSLNTCVNFADTEIDPIPVSEQETMAIYH